MWYTDTVENCLRMRQSPGFEKKQNGGKSRALDAILSRLHNSNCCHANKEVRSGKLGKRLRMATEAKRSSI